MRFAEATDSVRRVRSTMSDPKAASLFAKLSRELTPVASDPNDPSSSSSTKDAELNASNMMPRELDKDKSSSGRSSWWPFSSSRGSSLSSSRESSSIPISPRTELPKHQGAEKRTWQYPSEKMFYNAMERKGWKPSAGDMEQVVKIHNAVNERAWAHVMAWERRHCDVCPDPKLLRFQGKPKDYSPKARLLNFLGYKLPFDRHDWIVDRCGTEVRYIIDFYNAVAYGGDAPVAMHLDVRPALDSAGSVWDRCVVQASWMLSGEWMRKN